MWGLCGPSEAEVYARIPTSTQEREGEQGTRREARDHQGSANYLYLL